MSPGDNSQRTGEPMSAGQREMEGESVVARCEMTHCLYNQAMHCSAGAINVAFVNGMAACATFTPRQGAEKMPRSERHTLSESR